MAAAAADVIADVAVLAPRGQGSAAALNACAGHQMIASLTRTMNC